MSRYIYASGLTIINPIWKIGFMSTRMLEFKSAEVQEAPTCMCSTLNIGNFVTKL